MVSSFLNASIRFSARLLSSTLPQLGEHTVFLKSGVISNISDVSSNHWLVYNRSDHLTARVSCPVRLCISDITMFLSLKYNFIITDKNDGYNYKNKTKMSIKVLPGRSNDSRPDGIPPLGHSVTCLDICSRVVLQHQTQTQSLSFHQHIEETSKHHSISDLTCLLRPALSTESFNMMYAVSLWVTAGANQDSSETLVK